MKPTLPLYALLGVASAQKPAVTNQLCSTALGPTSVKCVKTSIQTVKATLTAYKKLCPKVIKTVTPKAETTTLTSTVTSTIVSTLPQETDTVTTTSIDEPSTSTSIVSQSTTITNDAYTTIVVTETPTSTIPAPAGFTPIASEPGFVAKKRNVPGRFALEARSKVASNFPQQRTCDKGKDTYFPLVYPQSVSCRKVIETVTTKTITAEHCKYNPTSTTYLPRETSTRYTTVTTTSTSLVGQVAETVTATASSTVTEITTSVSTQTDTTTLTETQTSVAPTATFYAACGSDNIISTANGGHGIGQVTYNSGTGDKNQVVQASSATTAYECCVACQTTANCIYSDFLFGACELTIGSACSPGSTFGTGFATSPALTGNGDGFVISNGACGYVPNEGDM